MQRGSCLVVPDLECLHETRIVGDLGRLHRHVGLHTSLSASLHFSLSDLLTAADVSSAKATAAVSYLLSPAFCVVILARKRASCITQHCTSQSHTLPNACTNLSLVMCPCTSTTSDVGQEEEETIQRGQVLR